MPFNSCSEPIGSWTATQRSDSCIGTARERGRNRRAPGRACSRRRPVEARAPRRAPGAGGLHLHAHDGERRRERPRQRASRRSRRPGSRSRPACRRVDLPPLPLEVGEEAASDICRRCSSSSQSETVVPASTVPSRFIFPAWKSMPRRARSCRFRGDRRRRRCGSWLDRACGFSPSRNGLTSRSYPRDRLKTGVLRGTTRGRGRERRCSRARARTRPPRSQSPRRCLRLWPRRTRRPRRRAQARGRARRARRAARAPPRRRL